jgi:hypothetical protein
MMLELVVVLCGFWSLFLSRWVPLDLVIVLCMTYAIGHAAGSTIVTGGW